MLPSNRRGARVRGAVGRTGGLVCLIAVLGVVLWLRARESGERSAVSGARQPTAPPAAVTGALEEPRDEREIATAPAEQRAPPPSPEPETAPVAAPASVHVTGAAIRVDPSGVEHATDDGSLALYTQADGRSARHDATVRGGRFELDVPPGATIKVTSLVLGGRPTRPEKGTLAVPRDHFLVLRADELRGVLLHVVSAADGRELDGVVVHEAGGPIADARTGHPGSDPEGPLRVRDGRSPVRIEPGDQVSWSSSAYWVRADGHAWGTIALEHTTGGERTIALQPACTLDVDLVGLEGWLRPRVRLRERGSDPLDPYGYAEREPDANGRARFESLAPGSYLVSAGRGWADDRLSFGEVSATIAAGQHATVALTLELPEPPTEVMVSGRLVLPREWSRDEVALKLEAQGRASVWAEDALSVPLAEMGVVSAAGSALETFSWTAQLPVAGAYELTITPFWVRRLLEVPPEGLSDVDVVVPAAADVEVHVLDEDSGEELAVERLFWSQPHVEGIRGSPLIPATRDAARGCVAFRVPAGAIVVRPVDQSLQVDEEHSAFTVAPGHNRLELRARPCIGVRIRLREGESELPWSWDWRLRAERVDGEARDRARSIGLLWFEETGTYRLFADGGVPGYASFDGTTFEVRALAPGEEQLELEIALQRDGR